VAAFDADHGFIFNSYDANGRLTLIHQETPDTYRVIATLQPQKRLRPMVLDPATHRIHRASARSGPMPVPTEDQPHPRQSVVPDSFVIQAAEPK
jgi:hypothetical protein